MKIFGVTLVFLALALTSCQGTSADIPCPFGPQALDQEGSVTLVIDNQACTTFCRVYLGRPSCADWGSDFLLEGRQRIPHGTSLSFQIPPGKYDLLVEDCTEAGYQMTNLNLRESQTLTFSPADTEPGEACQASLTVRNFSEAPVCHMWIAGPQSESFGNNWLTNDGTVPPGGEMTFVVLPGTYDVKAEDCDFNQLRLELGKSILDHQVWQIP